MNQWSVVQCLIPRTWQMASYTIMVPTSKAVLFSSTLPKQIYNFPLFTSTIIVSSSIGINIIPIFFMSSRFFFIWYFFQDISRHGKWMFFSRMGMHPVRHVWYLRVLETHTYLWPMGTDCILIIKVKLDLLDIVRVIAEIQLMFYRVLHDHTHHSNLR